MKKLGIMAAAAAALSMGMAMHAPQPTIKQNAQTRVETATSQQSNAQRSQNANMEQVTKQVAMDVKYLMNGNGYGYRSFGTPPHIYGRYLLMTGKNKYNNRKAKHYGKANCI